MMSVHFLRPMWFIAFLPIVICFWCILKKHWHDRAWQRVCDPKLLSRLLMTTSQVNDQRWPFALIALAWIVAVIALAGPTGSLIKQPIFQTGVARVVVLDVSEQMHQTDLLPSRFVRAKYKIQDLLEQSRGDNIGMIAFTSEPFVVSPLTNDPKTILNLLPDLYPEMMPVQGSDVAKALEKSAELMRQGSQKVYGDIVLVSASPIQEKDFATAKSIAASGIPISVLAVMADKNGAQDLKRLAEIGGGHFALMSMGDEDIRALKAAVSLAASQIMSKKEMTEIWQDQGYYLLPLLLAIVVLGFRRGWFEQILR